MKFSKNYHYYVCVLIISLLLSIVYSSSSADNSHKPSLETMIGQMIMVGFRGMTVEGSPLIVEDIQAGRIGGIIIFDYDVELGKAERNVSSPEQVKSLVTGLASLAPANYPLLTAVDMEGGKVARLKSRYGFSQTISAQKLGKINKLNKTRQAASGIGRTMSAMGLNLNFAPVVDVNINPDNPAIGRLKRSFSADPQKVAEHGQAFVQGLHDSKVLSTLKHFPGHGSAWNDSHHGMADVSDTWSEKELIPYQKMLANQDIDMVMTAHIFNSNLDKQYPATLSKAIITDLLRQKMGYAGVVVTDDMQMKAVTSMYGLQQAVELAINAGVDIILFGNNLVYQPQIAKQVQAMILDFVKQGKIKRQRIEQSFKRIMALKNKKL